MALGNALFCQAFQHPGDQVHLLLGHLGVARNHPDYEALLVLEAGTCTIRDPELVELLTSWASRPHRGRLLITCRHQFALPDVASPRIAFRHLGPLSRAGTIELATSLPALNLLGEHDLDLVWRLLGAGGYVYVCGAQPMRDAVRTAFADVIAEHGRLPRDRAEAYLDELETAARYRPDLWG